MAPKTFRPEGVEARATDGTSPVAWVRQSFARFFGAAEGVRCVRAPGRVNLVGDHTDYNEGFVLPMTLGRAVYVALRPRSDDRIRLHALNYDEPMEASLGDLPGRGRAWRHYVGGVVQALRDRGVALSGFDAVLYGDVPVGAGLSSSAATEVAMLIALQTAFGFEMDGAEAARVCQEVEHRFIEVQCGIMDPFVSRLGRAGHALLLDCRTLDYEQVPVALGGHCFVVADSRASRSLADSKYNERRGECGEGVAFFQRFAPDVRALRDVSVRQLDAHAGALPENVRRRCRHVVEENGRVREAASALKAGNLMLFGALMSASHASLRDLYDVSSNDLDRMVAIAEATEGVLGARMTGAGFGGCIVALARRTAVPALKRRLAHRYYDKTGRDPGVYVVEKTVEAGAFAL